VLMLRKLCGTTLQLHFGDWGAAAPALPSIYNDGYQPACSIVVLVYPSGLGPAVSQLTRLSCQQ
jgi:hypothetical protein